MITGDTRDYLFNTVLPKKCICAEIGVFEGVNSDRIIKYSKPKKLYLIDVWDDYENIKKHCLGRINKEEKDIERISRNQLSVMKKCYKIIINKYKNNKHVIILKEPSTSACTKFEDDYFDWVYIDASHDYESIKEDLNMWWPKIKGGGYLCGHDYNNIHVGVKKSVNGFCESKKLELYYKCPKENGGTDGASDWAIKKK